MELAPIHVLILDDIAEERAFVRAALEEMGPELVIYESASLGQAVTALEQTHIDVVILDTNLGGEPGLALISARERSRNPSVSFIVLAEQNDAERAKEALSQGAQDYLVRGEAPPRAIRRAVRYARERGRADRLERGLREAERHQSLGRVLLAVAHEINNPASWALNNLELITELAQDAIQGSPHAPNPIAALGEVKDLARDGLLGMERIRRVIHAIQEVAPAEAPVPTRVLIEELVTATALTLASEVRQRARWTQQITPGLAVQADRAALSRAIFHLTTNAVQAIDHGDPARHEVSVVAWAEGGQAHIEVADTGPGIAPADAGRLFEPFFTTRTSGERLGLGLWAVAEILRAHGGRVVYGPRAGGGSRFTLSLPLAPAAETPRTEGQPTPGSRRILLIDDEPLALRMMSRILSRGWPVVTAADAEAAIEILAQDTDFGLVLTDLILPGLDGLDLHLWICAHHPPLAERVCVLTSGKCAPDRLSRLRALGVPTFFKPASSEDLRALAARHCGAAPFSAHDR